MKIASIVGARPQFIKAAVIHREIKHHANIEEFIVHSGQHYDKNMSDIFFNELNIQSPKYNLEVGSGNHGWQTGLMLQRFEDVFIKESPDCVIVYGDTNSTLAAALAAAKLHIPVAHIEAGLRSFNKKMPEEINRITTDHLSDLLFAPTETAISLLEKEGLKEKSHFVGDVMYDSALHYASKLEAGSLGEPYFLATVHRAENTDDPKRLSGIIEAFNEMETTIVLPLHPRTKKFISEYNVVLKSHVKAIEPVGYKEMIALISGAEKILTDSGGLQKEAYFLKKPCITLRDETEWVETLENGWNQLVGADTIKILSAISTISLGTYKNYYGEGNAGKQIIELLKTFLCVE